MSGKGPEPQKTGMVLKPAPGQRAVSARLAMLPAGKPRWGVMGASMTVQMLVLGFLVLMPLFFPERMIPKMIFNTINIATPRTEVPVAPKPAAVRPKPQPVKMEEAKMDPPPVQPKHLMIVPHFEAPKVAPKVQTMEAPKVMTPVLDTPKIDVSMAEPAKPRKPVETGMLNSGSAAPATIKKAISPEKVQTGGFGDPDGMAGPAIPGKAANIMNKGSFDLPSGEGYGNGTGGAKGVRGTVQSTGFGNGTAIEPTGTGGGSHGVVRSGGFAQAAVETEKPKAQQQQAASVQPVEILEKPRPEYTQEARALKIEGEVVLSVVFKANGEIQVLRVIHGLGHGLDETATRAALKIKYKPAISNNQPVDFPATVHIVYQLAY